MNKNFYNVDELYEKLGFVPYAEFSTKNRAVNLSHPETLGKEADGLRQTGRTTRQLCKAIVAVLAGMDVEYFVYSDTSLALSKNKVVKILNQLGMNWKDIKNGVQINDVELEFKQIDTTNKVYFEPSFNDI